MRYIKPEAEVVKIENEDIVTASENCGIQLGQNCTSLNGLCSSYGGKSNRCDGPTAMVGVTNTIENACALFTNSGTWRCSAVEGISPNVNGTWFSCSGRTGGTCNQNLGAN